MSNIAFDKLFANKDNKIMPKSKQEVIDDFKNFIQSKGGNYSDWYIGIGRDSEDLFFHMMQNLNEPCWTYQCTYDPQVARQVLYYFIKTLGTNAAVSSIYATGDVIYVYKKKVAKESV